MKNVQISVRCPQTPFLRSFRISPGGKPIAQEVVERETVILAIGEAVRYQRTLLIFKEFSDLDRGIINE